MINQPKSILIFLLVTLFVGINCVDKQPTTGDDILNKPTDICSEIKDYPIEEKSKMLEEYFNSAKMSFTSKKEIDEKYFFCLFPDSFEEMESMFGYKDSRPAPLYSNGRGIIQYFAQLKSIPEDQFYRKYINICINGNWQADNIARGFDIDQLIYDSPTKFCKYIVEHSDSEIKSLFRFIFDGPHPKNERNNEIYDKLLVRLSYENKNVADLMKQAFTKLIQEDHDH